LETHGPLGTLWVGLGLCAFYIALVWINTLLGFVLTPLFIVPGTWLMDRVRGKAAVAHSTAAAIRPKEGATERQVIDSSDGGTQFVKVRDARLDFSSVSAAPP